MKQYVRGRIAGWMNRWTKAHAMIGFGLRQGGTRISLQCFHLKPVFYSVSFCSQTIKMEQGKKGATESSNDWVPSVFIPALPSPHLVSTVPGSKHHNTQNNRIGESTESALEPPWPFRPLLPLEDAIQKTTSDHLSKALTVLMLNIKGWKPANFTSRSACPREQACTLAMPGSAELLLCCPH